MSKLKVAFQGELGAYSHIACEVLFPGADIKTCPTFEETFKTAHQDNSYRIVFNSNWSKKRFLQKMKSEAINSEKLLVINQSATKNKIIGK